MFKLKKVLPLVSAHQSRREDVKFIVDMMKSDFPDVGRYLTWILVGFASVLVLLLYVLPTIRKTRNNA